MTLSSQFRWTIWLTLILGAGSVLMWGAPPPEEMPPLVVLDLPREDARMNLERSSEVRPESHSSRSDFVEDSTGQPTVTLVRVIKRDSLIPPTADAGASDPFSPRSWIPPAPPPPAPPPVAAPTAPALPYTLLGKKEQGGHWEVYLGQGDRVLIAREGSDLDNIYEVVRVDPPSLTLRYRPLLQIQQMDIGN